MPLQLDPEEAGLYQRNKAPGPHLDLLSAIAFRSAGAAVRLGVFDALAAGPATAADLARRLGADERGLGLLLDALVSFSYLARDGDGYANSELAATWLREGAPSGYTPVLLLWQALLFELWGDLERSLRDGGPALDFYAWLQGRPEVARGFQAVLRRLAGWLSGEVVDAVALPPSARRLLDVGGGHAAYSVAFCRHHPRLHATVLDLPGGLASAAETVAEAGLGDRVELREGDFRDGDLGTGYDLALLCNVVHGLEPARVPSLLEAVGRALRPGGLVAILDKVTEVPAAAGRSGEAFVRAFSLNLFHTQGGQVATSAQLAAWLEAAGFEGGRQRALRASPTDHLVTATLRAR